MKKAASKKVAGVSSDAVKAKTGRGWNEWFKLLDQAGARRWNHTQIAAHLYDKLRCPGWWNQMVAVGYEQARGMREKHQKPEGFQISRSKTLAVPLAAVYKAWQDDRVRDRWLADSGFTIRKATANKIMRITWIDGKTSVEVYFVFKGRAKSQVVVQHSKLADAKEAERKKKFWGEHLDRLQALLEK